MSDPRWRRALEMAAELEQATGSRPLELDDLLSELLLSRDGLPDVADVLCLADLLEEAGLSSSAEAFLDFGRIAYPEAADQVRIVITAAQHAVNHGDQHRAVALLIAARGLDATVDVSLAAVALAMGDKALAQDAAAAAAAFPGPVLPVVRATLAEVNTHLSAGSDADENAWQGALAAVRDTLEAVDPQVIGLLTGHALSRFEAAGTNGDRRTQREALTVLETAAILAASMFGATHPDAVRAQVAADLAGFAYSCLEGREKTVSDAWERLKVSADIQLASFGALHPEAVVTRISVAAAEFETARARRDVGAAREVLTRLDHARAEADMALGSRHASTIAAEANFATAQLELLYVQGRDARDSDFVSRTAADLSTLGQRALDVLGKAHPIVVALHRMTKVARSMGDSSTTDPDLGGNVAIRSRRVTLQGFYDPPSFGDSAYESVDRAASRTSADRVKREEQRSTLVTRHNLAYSYEVEGRLSEAIVLYEQVLSDSRRVFGDDHPDTLTCRHNLAGAYQAAGRVAEAITIYEQVLADSRRVLGDDHPDTLTSRHNLAGAYEVAGRMGEAVSQFEQVLTDRRRVLGDNHPHTLSSNHNLAYAYQLAGRVGEAVSQFEQVCTDHRRVLGEDYPDTLATRHNLADAYQLAGRVGDAIRLIKQVLADRRRVLGDNHRATRTTETLLRYVLNDRR